MKKLIALLLAAIMVMAIFVGCSSKPAETPSTDNPAADTPAATTDAPADVETPEGKTVKIGFIGWGYTDGLGSAYQRYLDYVAPYVGMEIVYGQYKTAEDIISQAESLIQAGCNVIMTTIASASLIDLCAKNEVYMAQWGSPVLDEELKAYLEQSPYWVGCSTVDDETSGAAMVDALYEAGSRHIAVLAPAAGNACHDARYKGIYDEVAKYDDMEVVSEFRDASLNTTAPAAIQKAYNQNKNLVCYSVGYNVDMLAVAPTAALTSPTNVWEVFYEYAFRAVMNGESFDQNWCQGYEADAVTLTPLGESCAPGTQEKVDETIAAIKDGSLHVFDTSKFTVTGDNFELTNTQKCKIECDAEGHVTSAMMVDTDGDWVADSEEGIADGYYHESSYQSAPSFQIRIDGITELN